MSRRLRVFIGTLLPLNAIVLLGQLWPDGAPPFAQAVNVGVLALDLVLLVLLLTSGRPSTPR